MTLKDINAVVSHWRDGAASELESAEILITKNKLLQGMFFCHWALEKILKALIVKSTREHAPYVHNLTYLAGEMPLECSKQQLEFLERMKHCNIMNNPAPRGGVSKGRHFNFCVASHGESTQGSSATGALRGSKQANFSQVAEGKLCGSDVLLPSLLPCGFAAGGGDASP